MTFATHVLVPTDFSQASLLAVEAAALIAKQFSAKLSVVHVHDPDGLRPPAQMAWNPQRLDDLETEIQALIQTHMKELLAGALANVENVESDVLEHEAPAKAICDYAEKVGADLIVISTHGRTGLKHLLIGSVAERVVRHATVPVLTLRSQSND